MEGMQIGSYGSANGLSAVAQNTSAFYTRYWKHANRRQALLVSNLSETF